MESPHPLAVTIELVVVVLPTKVCPCHLAPADLHKSLEFFFLNAKLKQRGLKHNRGRFPINAGGSQARLCVQSEEVKSSPKYGAAALLFATVKLLREFFKIRDQRQRVQVIEKIMSKK